MSDQQNQNNTTGKVGSDPKATTNIGGKGDFGVPVNRSRSGDRDYVSENTRRADPGAATPHAGEMGDRTTGAGGAGSGPGASSGGDLDPDFVGIAGGSGLAASGNLNRPPGADDTTGESAEFASGPPAKGEMGPSAGKVTGTTHDRSGEDEETNPTGRGADAISRSEQRDDDSFRGEISSGEAGGQDSR